MNIRIDQENENRRKTLRSKNEYRCSTCGHTVYIHPSKDKVLCEFCNRYIERNEKYNISHITLISRLQVTYLNYQRRLNEQIYN